MTRRALVVFGAVAFIAASHVATAQDPPARVQSGGPGGTAAGTASITGLVVADDAVRTPMRRAVATLSRPDLEDIRQTATDDAGRYFFGALPAGTYWLAFSKGGYISTNYGAPKPGVPGGRPITLAGGQVFAASESTLVRGGVIAGRVTDASGRPVEQATVVVSQVLDADGEVAARASTRRTANTNAHGEYRIYGLSPGDYFVGAVDRALAIAATLTEAEWRWAADRKGEPPPAARPRQLAVTLFPGTPDFASAAPISVAAGEERPGVDITLQSVPVADIAGVVVSADGRPAAGVAVRVQRAGGELLGLASMIETRSSADGSFRAINQQPGEYILAARTIPARGGGPAALGLAPAAGAPQPVEASWGYREVRVSGEDVRDVRIDLQRGATISGRIALPSGTTTPFPIESLRVSTVGAGPAARAVFVTAAAVSKDGTFELGGLPAGRHRVVVTTPRTPNATWMLESARQGTRDLADEFVDVAPAQRIADVVLRLTDRPAQIAGTVIDAGGRPVSDLNVFAFPVSEGLWDASDRRIKTVRASDAGSFTIDPLPAGEYFLCALVEVDRELMYSRAYLRQLVPASIKLTLREGERLVQDLRVR